MANRSFKNNFYKNNSFKDNFLLWVDLEMTGLNPEIDSILEIAAIITDTELNIIGTMPSIVIQQDKKTLQLMDDWNKKTHASSGLIEKVLDSKINEQEAEKKVIDFVTAYLGKKISNKRLFLAGNSIYQDRNFLKKYMKKLNNLVHYRLIDVSSIKELVKSWYPEDKNSDYKKRKAHRALEDITESIEELKHYRKHFFK